MIWFCLGFVILIKNFVYVIVYLLDLFVFEFEMKYKIIKKLLCILDVIYILEFSLLKLMFFY